MGFFTPSHPSKDSFDNSGAGPIKKKDFFGRYGFGSRISPRVFANRMRYAMMRPAEKEYVKSVMQKFDAPLSKGITREEFQKGLGEMQRNRRDRITDPEIKKIKDLFK